MTCSLIEQFDDSKHLIHEPSSNDLRMRNGQNCKSLQWIELLFNFKAQHVHFLFQFFAPLVDRNVDAVLLSLNLRNRHENDARTNISRWIAVLTLCLRNHLVWFLSFSLFILSFFCTLLSLPLLPPLLLYLLRKAHECNPRVCAGDDLPVIYRISFIKWMYVYSSFCRVFFLSFLLPLLCRETKVVVPVWRQFLHGIWWHLYSFIYALKCVTLRFLRHSFMFTQGLKMFACMLTMIFMGIPVTWFFLKIPM